MALPLNRIKKIKLNDNTTYDIVPESLEKNGHQAALPELSVDSTIAMTSDLPTKQSLGLNNVDNTSDLNKPVSTATQTALDAKQATLVSGTNIKTINNESVLGSGNLEIEGRDIEVVASLPTTFSDDTVYLSDTNAATEGGIVEFPIPTVADAGKAFVIDSTGAVALGEAGGARDIDIVSTLPTTGEDDTVYLADSNASSTGGIVELPVPTAADEGKVFKVNSTGGVELGTAGGGGTIYSHDITFTLDPHAFGDHNDHKSGEIIIYSSDPTPALDYSVIRNYIDGRGKFYVSGYAIDTNDTLCLCLALEFNDQSGYTMLTSRPVNNFATTKQTDLSSFAFLTLNDVVKAI